MEYRTIGRTGLVLSEIGLGSGSATFVGRVDDEAAKAIVHRALDIGITYFDTAETYAEGRAEQIFGKSLSGVRDRVVIASKFGKDRSVGAEMAPGSRRNIMRAIEGSLRRLQTDYLDLYIFHMPDPRTPIEETVHTLDDLVRAGKVRYIGCSDFAAWELSEAVWISRSDRIESFATAGAEYNMLSRGIEHELLPCCRKYGVGMVPTFPLASGFLSGKYRPGVPPPVGSRFATVPEMANATFQDLSRYDRAMSSRNFAALNILETFANERGHVVSELALAWLLAQPGVAAVPVGVTSTEQLERNIRGIEWRLDRDDLAEIDRRLEAVRVAPLDVVERSIS